MNRKCLLAVLLIWTVGLGAAFAQNLRLVAVATAPTVAWEYEGATTFVRPGDRFAGAPGAGLELQIQRSVETARFDYGASLGYRLTRLQELTQYPRQKPVLMYNYHRAYTRLHGAYRPVRWASIDGGVVASFIVNDPGDAILEDYRGLSAEEAQLLPSFNDPVGRGGVYMQGGRFNYGPSVGVNVFWRKLSAHVRYDYLLGKFDGRSLRELDLVNGGTVPLQTSTLRVRSEWSFGLGYRFSTAASAGAEVN